MNTLVYPVGTNEATHQYLCNCVSFYFVCVPSKEQDLSCIQAEAISKTLSLVAHQ